MNATNAKTNRKQTGKKPIIVGRGSGPVKIYRTSNHGYRSFTVSYYFANRRVRKTFADRTRAEQEAKLIVEKLGTGQVDVLTLTSDDRLAYIRATNLLAPSGVPLELAVLQFVEASRLLEGASLVEAAKFYVQHQAHKIAPRPVSQVVADLLASKEADGLSEVYVKDLRTRLTAFSEAFQTPISMILAPELHDYLHGLKFGPRSKNNTRKAITLLFNFAQARGYLPKGPTEADDLPLAKQPNNAIAIFRPEEMAKLLDHADAELAPVLARGAFAGLRTTETLRLDWSEVDLAGGHIEIKAAKAKTASRRLVPITENLRQWLAPHHQGSGKVFVQTGSSLNHKLAALARSDGVKVQWHRNALRHSFISYRVAQTQNVAQVALEAGNSPKIIFSNYRELVKPAAAEKWFAVVPARPANVVTVRQLAGTNAAPAARTA